MLPVAWLITALLPTMATPLVIISTAPATTVSRAQSGSLRRGRPFPALPDRFLPPEGGGGVAAA
ncbi:hypothetical protein GCM10009541_37490 [Micromonospora gifhornensis]|uniref:Secreted protein n=1 Tax=Micromonospora gifhornensis TaxID=84594 RepID=A0ABQ4IK61_9ACTN|nr:hypothetical protein Vgi01_49780 [Micromonospora gifhornensis]